MCFPCWPFTDVYIEEESKKKKKKPKKDEGDQGVMVFNPNTRQWVKISGPQVPDTSNGPHEHTYIPRSDGAIIVNGVVYLQEAKTPAPAPASVPTPVVPAVAPVIIPAPQYQQTMPQPAFQPYPYNPYTQFAGHSHHIPFGAGYVPQPAMNTHGATSSEIQMQQMQTPDVNKKQDMKPADDDPFRMYWVRELDNTWTQRNRMAIDSGDIGDVRWYVTEGVFYAVRLES